MIGIVGTRVPAAAMLLATVLGSAIAAERTGQTDRRLARPPAEARRVALVVGNDRYPEMPLRNAVNDARAMSAALTEVGFDVQAVTDAGFKQLTQSIDRFIASLRADDVALVYYAGHGVQVEGENFLMPIDFSAKDEAEVRYEGYSASRLADRMSGSGARLTILVLDACRNNPFRTSRSGGRGLAAMNGASGSLIAFATAPGSTADDNTASANGLFTTHLLAALKEPGLSVEQVFSRVRQKVHEASGRRQTPWLVSSVIGDFVFRPGTAAARRPDTVAPVDAGELRRREDLALYEAVKGSTNIALLEDYLRRFPDGLFRLAVEERIQTQRSGSAASPPPARTPPSVTPPASRRTSTQARFEQTLFFKGQDGKIYLPYALTLSRDLLTRTGVAAYVRAIATSAPAPGGGFPWDGVLFKATNELGAGGRFDAAIALEPGSYRLFVAVKAIDRGTGSRPAPGGRTKEEQAAVEQLVKLVDDAAAGPLTYAYQPDVVLLEETLEVPPLQGTMLRTSSVIVASSVTPVAQPMTSEEQQLEPYTFGSMRIVPIFGHPRLSRSGELQIVFWVYNARTDSGGKPDVTIEYEFSQEAPDGSKYFNKTAPQQLNRSTLPPTFDVAAGHQLPGSLVVPLQSFPPGAYLLQIKVRDNLGGNSADNQVRLTVVP